ncbi:MAG: glycosyltransferase family 4 protein [Gomphosphaeria aponina SAG 52.96 = DSM 107014]|uniref:Glycosyltransferase family 4 protein n=1 Tax=Gomphosphaeria aponina SAG 52.96 = DSM 107014 TaxID=1521640 RepID=A0A941JNF7_9CHRO|nr:glycosyltransferase family 4 protein [Gomphosphaeria aponina SAG 52.96 = DSM 107014]
MKRIAIYYPYFLGGGAEAVVLWILEALKTKYDLTLFTFTPPNFHLLNTMYRTNLSNQLIKIHPIFPPNLSNIGTWLIANNQDIRKIIIHLILRKFKAKSQEYDLVLSAYNAADLGKKGIQYIHWVKVIEGGKQIYNQISNFSPEKLKENISLTNSSIVAETIKKTYGIKAAVIYPPVVINLEETSWENKENAFICSGRLVQAKQPHKVINILKAVREKDLDIKLYLTGGGGGVAQWKYKNFLKKIVAENSNWVKMYENLSSEEYAQILKQCKYGIHYKKEPFGIVIAEMLKAGAIPFVRSEGGQVEIVGKENQELLFDQDEEAVEKIVIILQDRNKQKKLLNSLKQKQAMFSTEKFMKEINQVVENYLNQNPPLP